MGILTFIGMIPQMAFGQIKSLSCVALRNQAMLWGFFTLRVLTNIYYQFDEDQHQNPANAICVLTHCVFSDNEAAG
jgi:hypothetical protein